MHIPDNADNHRGPQCVIGSTPQRSTRRQGITVRKSNGRQRNTVSDWLTTRHDFPQSYTNQVDYEDSIRRQLTVVDAHPLGWTSSSTNQSGIGSPESVWEEQTKWQKEQWRNYCFSSLQQRKRRQMRKSSYSQMGDQGRGPSPESGSHSTGTTPRRRLPPTPMLQSLVVTGSASSDNKTSSSAYLERGRRGNGRLLPIPPNSPQSPSSSVDVSVHHQHSAICVDAPPILDRTVILENTQSERLHRHSFYQPVFQTPMEGQQSLSTASNEKLIRKSSSDTESPTALGLDPKLYRQSSVSSTSVPELNTVIGSLSTSNSWPDSAVEPPRPTGLGLLHYSLQHFPVRRRLRVSIIKVEGLAGQLRPELELHAFCKLSIMPGKSGKQQSRIVKHSRDAIFNEEFFFDHIGSDEIAVKSIGISVCHHSGKQFQKDVVIGDVNVLLREISELQTKKEIRLIEELKPRINLKKLGKLHTSMCLEKKDRRLTINVIKADDIPKWGIAGPPDPCIRITLTQQNRKTQIKQSRTLKRTCNAVFREAVMFLISTDPVDLAATSIVLSVHDTARTAAGDDLIGSAFLGTMARDRTEREQWRNVVSHPGKEFKAVHQLKLPHMEMVEQTPNVHVSQTRSESD